METWRALDRSAELVIVDDRSDPARLAAVIGDVAAGCELLLGPYSTQLMRAAARALAGSEAVLIWNHGGSGDDVASVLPGRVVSVPTPASRYADPFLRRVRREGVAAPLRIARGPGTFGRQVAAGAESLARRLGIEVVAAGAEEDAAAWDMLSAGTFEDDVAAVRQALARPRPPRLVCSVAAGIQEFARAVPECEGIHGVAQWFPGSGASAELEPAEADFLAAYRKRTGAAPDYPAVQAAAAAALATRCASLVGGTAPDALWSAAASLDTSTLFGPFRIDPTTGVQVGHETVLVRWTAGGLTSGQRD